MNTWREIWGLRGKTHTQPPKSPRIFVEKEDEKRWIFNGDFSIIKVLWFLPRR